MLTRKVVMVGCSAIAAASVIGVGCSMATVSSHTTGSQNPIVVRYGRSCEKKANTQPAMNACVQSELAQVRPQLAVALALEAKRVSKAKVTAAQDAWKKYLEAECGLEASTYEGGSIYPLIVLQCELRLTVSRTTQVLKVAASSSR